MVVDICKADEKLLSKCFMKKIYHDDTFLGRGLSYDKNKKQIRIYNLETFHTLIVNMNNLCIIKYTKDHETYNELVNNIIL